MPILIRSGVVDREMITWNMSHCRSPCTKISLEDTHQTITFMLMLAVLAGFSALLTFSQIDWPQWCKGSPSTHLGAGDQHYWRCPSICWSPYSPAEPRWSPWWSGSCDSVAGLDVLKYGLAEQSGIRHWGKSLIQKWIEGRRLVYSQTISRVLTSMLPPTTPPLESSLDRPSPIDMLISRSLLLPTDRRPWLFNPLVVQLFTHPHTDRDILHLNHLSVDIKICGGVRTCCCPSRCSCSSEH